MSLHDAAFYCLTFFLLGVALASFGWAFLPVVFLCTLIGSFFYWRKSRALALTLFAVLLGFGYFHFFYATLGREKITYNQKIDFEGMIVNNPALKEKYQEFILSLNPPQKGKIRVLTQRYPRFNYGDVLKINGAIEQSQYGKEGVAAFPKIILVESGRGNKIRAALFDFKRGMVENIQAVLSDEKSALLSGIILGERASMTEEFKNAMRGSGTSHIVALSGYNISILALSVSMVFSSVFSRKNAFYLSVLAVILFVAMTGAEASVVRSALMGVVVLLAERVSRLYSMRNASVAAASFMVLFNPKVLVFDVGFQLSFGALLGIVYLGPALRQLFKLGEESGFLSWKENGLATVSAQLAVLPILVNNFGELSVFSVLANVLILAFIPLTMFLGFAVGAAGFISYYFSQVLGWFVGVFLGYEIFVMKLFSGLAPSLQLGGLSFFIIVIYYGFLLAAILYANSAVKPKMNQYAKL